MPSQKVLFEGADVDQLYRGGKPSSWEVMLERAKKSSRRRHRISGDEAKEMAYAVQLLQARGGDIPDTPRECYLQMLEALEPIPTPGVYPA